MNDSSHSMIEHLLSSHWMLGFMFTALYKLIFIFKNNIMCFGGSQAQR